MSLFFLWGGVICWCIDCYVGLKIYNEELFDNYYIHKLKGGMLYIFALHSDSKRKRRLS